jgi:3-hydroxyisobutyrate dehydrogenase-like beta-hydroxyacid dehydrogenase
MTSPAIKGSLQRIQAGSFEPRLTTTLLAKDLRLLNEAAASTGSVVPMAGAAAQLYRSAANMGWADQDTAAVLLLLQRLSGLQAD